MSVDRILQPLNFFIFFLPLAIQVHNPSYVGCCRTNNSGHRSSAMNVCCQSAVYLLPNKSPQKTTSCTLNCSSCKIPLQFSLHILPVSNSKCSCQTSVKTGIENHFLQRTSSQQVNSLKLFVCLPINQAYWFHLYYNQLILVCVRVAHSTVYSVHFDITFIFIRQKDKTKMVGCKGHPGQKQLN